MKVHVISYDSDIGREIMTQHLAAGDTVTGTTRDYASVTDTVSLLELTEKTNWPAPPIDADRIYFLLAVSDNKVSPEVVFNVNAVLPVNYLGYFASKMRPGTQVVIMSSQFGSITRCINGRAYIYRMSKAALNMGARCLAHAHKHVQWCVYHPGIVKTKMVGDNWKTFNFEVLEREDAAKRCIKIINEWDGQFRFLSYDGTQLEW